MGITKPSVVVPERTLRRSKTEIVYESDESVLRIRHHYEDGSVRTIEGAELREIATGETTKTWLALARRLGKALDGDSTN